MKELGRRIYKSGDSGVDVWLTSWFQVRWTQRCHFAWWWCFRTRKQWSWNVGWGFNAFLQHKRIPWIQWYRKGRAAMLYATHDLIFDEITIQGFYTVYRALFQKLSDEEEDAFRNDPSEDDVHSFTPYPSFGDSKTPFADSDGYRGYGAYVRDFYNAWTNFTTVKSFSWMEKWRLSEAPNRYVRRAMEKENKKAREMARKEYNDTVRVSGGAPRMSQMNMTLTWYSRVLPLLYVSVILDLRHSRKRSKNVKKPLQLSKKRGFNERNRNCRLKRRPIESRSGQKSV